MKAKNIQILLIISLYIFSCTKFDLPEKCNDRIPDSNSFKLKGVDLPNVIVLSKNDVNPLLVTVEGNYTANWTITGTTNAFTGTGQSAPLLNTYTGGIYVVRAKGKNSCGFDFDISKSITLCVDSSPAEIIITVNSDKSSTCTLKDGGTQKVDWTLVDKVTNESFLVIKDAISAKIEPSNYPSGNFTLTAKGKSGCSNVEFTLTKDYTNDYFDILSVGGNSNVKVNDIDTDMNGNIYVTGLFTGVWNTTKGTFTTWDSEPDFFVAKYSKLGVLDWIRTVGSPGADISNTIAVEPNGDLYVSGTMKSIGYFGSFKRINPTGEGMFIVKFNTNGVIQWLNEGSKGVVPKELVISNNGIIYLLGDHIGSQEAYLTRTDNPNLQAILTPNATRSQSAFVVRYSSTGQITNVLRPDNSYAKGITVDLNENVYVCATTLGISGGSARIHKYNSAGTLIWTKIVGNTDVTTTNSVQAISVDKFNNIYISAYFANSVNKLPVSITVGNRTITGPATYVAKYSDAGEIQWVQTLDKGFASSHKTDAEGNSYICGFFQDFYNLGTFYKQSNGSNDAFVTKFSKDGDILRLETLGGSNNDFANCITLDKGKNFYVSGSFLGTLVYKGTTLTKAGSESDSFILRLDK